MRRVARDLERVCRDVARPGLTNRRLAEVDGWVRYEFERPYRDGTTQLVFDLSPFSPTRGYWRASAGQFRSPPQALDFIARLAALVPKPRVTLTQLHGVFAPLCPLGATAAYDSK